MVELSDDQCLLVDGGSFTSVAKSVLKKVGVIAAYDAASDFANGFVDGVKSEM